MWHTPHTALLSSQHERDEQAFIENKYQELSARIDNTASHLIVAGDWNAHSSNKPPPDITFMWRSQSVAQHSDQQIFATLENSNVPLVVANPAGEININKIELLAILHALLRIPSHQPAIIATDSRY
mmetsp:Transcript_37583/g.60889  ORF Transcript_37583/g.60889 Transcript_37583/m.60889 type:complete len:127 (-) Transcript_37583:164-544(-)